MADKKSFLVYHDTKKMIDVLTDEQAGRLFKALFNFAIYGEVTDFSKDGMLFMAFGFMSAQMERDGIKYEKKCEKNRQIAMEREKKKREKNSTNVNERTRTYTNSTDTDTETDNDTDTEKDTDTDTDTETDTNKLSDKSGHTPKSSKSKKRKFGEYGHVRLTDEEYQRLCDDYGQETVNSYIAKCDEYCEIKPKTYGNYNLAIRNWLNRDNIRKRSDNCESSPIYRSPDPSDAPF